MFVRILYLLPIVPKCARGTLNISIINIDFIIKLNTEFGVEYFNEYFLNIF